MKKKKLNPRFFVTVGILLVVILAVVMILTKCTGGSGDGDYIKAYENTNKLSNYEMKLSLMITVEGENAKNTTIDQVLTCAKKGSNMIYKVTTNSTQAVASDGKVSNDSSAYTYYDGKYYYDLPGLKYSSNVSKENAMHNLESFTNVIAFDWSEMDIFDREIRDDETIYSYKADFEDVSDYVKSVCQSAVKMAGEGNYTQSATMSATVKDGYVTARDMFIECEGENGEYVTVEFVTELVKREAQLEKPDESQYPEIKN